jgi:hypothetical protein
MIFILLQHLFLKSHKCWRKKKILFAFKRLHLPFQKWGICLYCATAMYMHIPWIKMPVMTISTMVHILLLVIISPVECMTQSDYYPYSVAKYKKVRHLPLLRYGHVHAYPLYESRVFWPINQSESGSAYCKHHNWLI